MKNLERAIYLLDAAKRYLENIEDGWEMSNITVNYDGADCDGACLKEDIEMVLEEIEIEKKKKPQEKQNTICANCKSYNVNKCLDCGLCADNLKECRCFKPKRGKADEK